jgi:acyl carrier protein
MHCCGPAELPWACCAGEVTETDLDTLSTLPGMCTFVVQRVAAEQLRPVAPGAVGELALGGPAVVRASSEDDLKRRFLPAPLGSRGVQTLLLTGQRVRWTKAGKLQFMLDAKEHAEAQKLVGQAAAKASSSALDEDSKAVSRRQPAVYQVLNKVVVLDLPNMQTRCALATVAQVVAIVREVLGLDDVPLDDDLFELGADSLRITRIAGRIRSGLSVELQLSDVYRMPTVAALCELVRMQKKHKGTG